MSKSIEAERRLAAIFAADVAGYIAKDYEEYPSIVNTALFKRARTIIEQRSNHYSDDEMLSILSSLLTEEGR